MLFRSLGIENVGKKTARDLAEKFRSIDALFIADKETLINMQDIGEITAEGIYDFFNNEENKTQIQKLLEVGVSPFIEEIDENGVFYGENVVLTGTLLEFKRDEASKIIEKEGGKIMSGVSKSTTLVIAGESAGSKLDKAKKLGIKIIDEAEFKSLIKT